jgi:hypothetical protein
MSAFAWTARRRQGSRAAMLIAGAEAAERDDRAPAKDAKCDWHLHESLFACSMFFTMVLRLVQESATELHYTLRESAYELSNSSIYRTSKSWGRASPSSIPFRWRSGTWSLEADSHKIQIRKGDEHDSD